MWQNGDNKVSIICWKLVTFHSSLLSCRPPFQTVKIKKIENPLNYRSLNHANYLLKGQQTYFSVKNRGKIFKMFLGSVVVKSMYLLCFLMSSRFCEHLIESENAQFCFFCAFMRNIFATVVCWLKRNSSRGQGCSLNYCGMGFSVGKHCFQWPL